MKKIEKILKEVEAANGWLTRALARLDSIVEEEETTTLRAKAIGEVAWKAFELLGKADYAMGIVVDMTKGKVHTNFEEGQEKVKQAEAIIKDILPIREK